MPKFVGRREQLQVLERELAAVRAVLGGEEPGRCLLIRGRRRVGKSRLVEAFLQRADVPTLFFTASRQGVRELELFTAEAVQSSLPDRAVFDGVHPDSWDAALRLLASALPDDRASVFVLDEFPYLVEDDVTVEATLQKQWDRHLSRKPVLLLVVGSDLAMMELLDTYGRAFYQRGGELVVPPLSPVETAEIVGASDPAAAFDAYLVTGGLPLVCTSWRPRRSLWRFLSDSLADPTSPLIVSGERALAAEFPRDALARVVLERIGAGERTFTNIRRAAGGLQAASLNRALDLLIAKRVVAKDTPLSAKKSADSRYRVADPYLRFWLRFIGPHFAEIERGRGDRVLERVRRDWTTWRGRAIEPVIRDALSRLLPIEGLPPADVVGAYWTRSNTPEIDIVAADRGPVAKRVAFTGTIKWLERSPVDQRDLRALTADTAALAGAGSATPVIAVSRSGVHATGFAATLGSPELLAAW